MHSNPSTGAAADCQHTLFSIYGPGARRGEFEQMAVGIAKVEAPAARFPTAFLFYRDPFLAEQRLPADQFLGWDGECEMQFAAPVVWR